MFDNIDEIAVNSIRTLSIDAIERAKTGHPGIAMDAAAMIYSLFKDHLIVNPKNSSWFNRDRFVLSSGHGSILLYSILHLSGYDISMEDIKSFRKIHKKLQGHPEVHCIDGVEATTGPLGQGLANAVGMAMAERHLSSIYNREGFNIIDHYTYALVSDGDLQEGISHEAMSLAGHLGLNKLILLYDSNDVQLDGPTSMAFSENIKLRAQACNWNYLYVEDGNSLDDISSMIEEAKKSSKPTIIEIKTVIGYGSPGQGTAKVHGSPLGEENILMAKKAYKWDREKFDVPSEVYERFNNTIVKRGKEKEEAWNKLIEEYSKIYEKEYKELKKGIDNILPDNLLDILPRFKSDEKMATRDASGKVINDLAKYIENFWGGSADLAGSNKTRIKSSGDFSKDDYSQKNIWYGVREHAMGAIMNGIYLHGGSKTFASTFLVFVDYIRPAIRVAALSKLPVIYIFTHDSVAVGADGPTHQPVEQLASLRSMPNLNVIRPCDGNEVSGAWKIALESKDRPTIIALTRQKLPILKETEESGIENTEKGAYIISKAKGEADGILIASGSEVSLAIRAKDELLKRDIHVSVVSMPCMEIFDEMDDEYKEKVLPKNIKKRLAIEMGSSFGWYKYVGDNGRILSIDRFGLSGDENDVINYFGFNVDNIVNEYLKM